MNAARKYSVIERERRFLIKRIPDGVVTTKTIMDRYIDATRLRLREVSDQDGTVARKLGQKIRIGPGPGEILCTSIYLNDAEWDLLRGIPARRLHKTRHIIERDGIQLAVDALEDGTLIAEMDDGDDQPCAIPAWLEVIREVTEDEQWTGSRLAQ